MSEPLASLEAERCVLGAVLLADTALPGLREMGLRPEHFYWDAHGVMFAAMLEMGAVDYFLLAERLRGTVSRSEIDLLASSVPAVGHAREYARIVMELWECREYRRAGHRVVEYAEARDAEGLQRACRWFADRVAVAPVVPIEVARARRSA